MVGKKVIALYNFKGNEADGELSFVEGDVIEVRVTQDQKINRAVEERHTFPQFAKCGEVRSAVDDNLLATWAGNENAVALSDIEKSNNS